MRSVVLVALLLAACSSQSAKEPAPAGEPSARDDRASPDQPAKPTKPAPGDAAAAASPIPADTEQLVLGISDDWDDATIELASYERDGAGWNETARWPATLGHAGLGWGRGLHGDAAPEGRDGPVKAEGDGKSPAGVFGVGKVYGYAKSAPDSATVPYTQVDPGWRCVDDPASAHYNKIVDEKAVTVDWKSSENMKRGDELYRWVIEVEHNHDATPKAGSCIFLHVWRGPDDTTVGCAAMERDKIETLIAWLDPAKKPVVVLLPRAERDALKDAWALP